MWLHVFLDISGCLGVQMWSDLLLVIFLDGEFMWIWSCQIEKWHISSISSFFFPPFLERPGAPCPGLGPLISGTGHMESLRSTLYGIRGFGIEAARKVSVDDSFGDKKTTQKTLGIIIYDNSNNKHNNDNNNNHIYIYYTIILIIK